MPLVSVVIPAYGHRDLIVRTLESVFAQTFTDYEVIVINDGSPDDTEAALQPYISQRKIRYLAQKNAGVAAARNHGISLAQGEFIALLDDDDLWPPDKLATQVVQLQANPKAVMVYGSIEVIDAGGAPLVLTDALGNPRRLNCDGADNPGPSGSVYAEFAQDNWIISPGQTVIRHSALKELGGAPFDTQIWGADDWDLWLRLCEIGELLYFPKTALQYRYHADNASKNEIRLQLNCLKVFRKQLTRNRTHPERYAIMQAAYKLQRAHTYVRFFHLAWLDYDRVVNKGDSRSYLYSALKKLAITAFTNPRACWNRKFFQLTRGTVRKIININKNKVDL